MATNRDILIVNDQLTEERNNNNNNNNNDNSTKQRQNGSMTYRLRT